MNRIHRGTLIVQGAYYAVTGVWPVASIRTFEWVTGPKTDDWLVQTVGLIILAIGITLLVGAARQSLTRETAVLAVFSAFVFIGIDVTFVSMGQISSIYLLDAVAQAILLGFWLLGWVSVRRPRTGG